MEVDRGVELDMLMSGILGVLVGLIAGHRLSLGRDKRKEFNEATAHFRGKLKSHISYLERRLVIHPMTAADISKIVETLGEKRSETIVRRFDRYIATVKKCVPEASPFQEGLPTSPGCWEEIISDAENLYTVVQPK